MPAPAAPVNNPATHGKEGIVAISVGAGTLTAVGNVSDWALNMAADKVETTALGDANKRYVLGLRDLSGTFTAFWDRTEDAIFEAAESATGCTIAIYPSASSPVCWTGPAWLDANLKGGVSAAVTIDCSFSANGAWVRTPAALTRATPPADEHKAAA